MMVSCVQFRCYASQSTMIGFAITANAKSAHYGDITCGVYCGKGLVHGYEYGNHQWTGTNYNDRTVFTVRRQVPY